MLLWCCNCVLCSIVVTIGNRYTILFCPFICISLLHYPLHKSSIDEHLSNRNNGHKDCLGLLLCTRQHAKSFSSIFPLNPHNCYVRKAASTAGPSGVGSLVVTPSRNLLPWSVGQTQWLTASAQRTAKGRPFVISGHLPCYALSCSH